MQPDIAVVTVIDETPAPTFTTMPGIASMNSVYADHNCGEEDGTRHRDLKGESMGGVEGWGPERAWAEGFYELPEAAA